jgi:3-methylfumaryl-CoA hydratase
MENAAYQSWAGKTETAIDIAAAGPLERLSALLDHDEAPWQVGFVPPLGHWLYFLPSARQSRLSEDGHPQRGGLLPDVPLPRRMWAGGRLEFLEPIPVGAEITKRSTILSVVPKSGKSGQMMFVTVKHEVFDGDRPAIIEEQDIVYRERAAAGQSADVQATPALVRHADSERQVTADPVVLFRYSALTFNGHRIHYDRDYARDVEGYKALVVHGPLLATLLMDHYLRQHPRQRIRRFTFRAQQPLFDTDAFMLGSAETEKGAELWAAKTGMPAAMTAQIEIG